MMGAIYFDYSVINGITDWLSADLRTLENNGSDEKATEIRAILGVFRDFYSGQTRLVFSVLGALLATLVISALGTFLPPYLGTWPLPFSYSILQLLVGMKLGTILFSIGCLGIALYNTLTIVRAAATVRSQRVSKEPGQ
jgi:hypothetical protein